MNKIPFLILRVMWIQLSSSTIIMKNTVDNCPTTEYEWIQRRKLAGCGESYHCLTVDRMSFSELCMDKTALDAKSGCPYVNTTEPGFRLRFFSCAEDIPGCPNNGAYVSTKIFRYEKCFELIDDVEEPIAKTEAELNTAYFLSPKAEMTLFPLESLGQSTPSQIANQGKDLNLKDIKVIAVIASGLLSGFLCGYVVARLCKRLRRQRRSLRMDVISEIDPNGMVRDNSVEDPEYETVEGSTESGQDRRETAIFEDIDESKSYNSNIFMPFTQTTDENQDQMAILDYEEPNCKESHYIKLDLWKAAIENDSTRIYDVVGERQRSANDDTNIPNEVEKKSSFARRSI